MITAIEALLKYDVAGDPITGVRWTHRTTEKIAQELATVDIQICPRTVARILDDLGYRLRVNHKRISAGSGPDRDQQFTYIAKHIANATMRVRIEQVCRQAGYEPPVICTPNELMEANDARTTD